MAKFNNINDAIFWIENQRRAFGNKDLKKLKEALYKLNINLKESKTIHILGTNGKGSTQAFISNVLINNNYKVGAFTSPYLLKFNERIKINNNNIIDKELLDLINYFYNFNIKYNYNLSFFELLTLMSFKYFSEQKCDVIIIEAGIGGLLDSTNIINYDITVITSIGYDHTNILGNTLKEIAYQKVGALKDNGVLIAYNNLNYIDVFNQRVKETNSKFISLDIDEYKKYNLNTKLLGKHQKRNAILAIEAIKYLFKIDDLNIIKYINNTTWDGRFEEISKNVFIDGAHNIDAIKALIETINSNFYNNDITIIFSALKDKKIEEMINLLNKENYEIILTSFPDFRFESLQMFETDKIVYNENVNELIKNVNKNNITIFTGSLHFIGFIKGVFNNENDISH